MKKALIKALSVLILMTVFLPTTPSAKASDTYIGVAPGYNTSNKSATFGAWMSYDFSRAFRTAVSIDYVFRNQNTDAFLINLDFNFPLKLGVEKKVDIYPIAGVTYACWSSHPKPDEDDVTTRQNKFGINLGAGAGLKVSDRMRLKLDVKYSLVKHNHTTIISLGIGYAF